MQVRNQLENPTYLGVCVCQNEGFENGRLTEELNVKNLLSINKSLNRHQKEMIDKRDKEIESLKKENAQLKSEKGAYGVIESYVDGYSQGQKTVINELEKFVKDRS